MQISCSTVWELITINGNTFCTRSHSKQTMHGNGADLEKKKSLIINSKKYRHIHMPSKEVFTLCTVFYIAIRKQDY